MSLLGVSALKPGVGKPTPDPSVIDLQDLVDCPEACREIDVQSDNDPMKMAHWPNPRVVARHDPLGGGEGPYRTNKPSFTGASARFQCSRPLSADPVCDPGELASAFSDPLSVPLKAGHGPWFLSQLGSASQAEDLEQATDLSEVSRGAGVVDLPTVGGFTQTRLGRSKLIKVRQSFDH